MGYEYEKEETTITADISTSTKCKSCKVYGGKEALLDGNPSTKFILKATSDVDIASSAIVVNIDVRYSTRKTHLNHFSITSSDDINFDPSEVGIQARDEVEGSWTSIHLESNLDWAGRQEKKQIMFNNPKSYFEYQLTLKKKANSNKLEISDCDLLKKFISPLAVETYYKLKNIHLFRPSIVQPKKGFMIGMVNNPSRNFIVGLKILPLGKIDDLSNIYVFKHKILGVLIGKHPSLNFLPDSYKFASSFMDQEGTRLIEANQDSLTEGVESTVVTKVIGEKMTLYVDGQVVGATEVRYFDRPDFTTLYAFVSDDSLSPAHVTIKNLRFMSVYCAAKDERSQQCSLDLASVDSTNANSCCEGLVCEQGTCVERCAKVDEKAAACNVASAEAKLCCGGLTCGADNKCVLNCAGRNKKAYECGALNSKYQSCCDGLSCNKRKKCV